MHACGSFFAVPVWAATLTVSDNFEIEVLDGQLYRAEGGLFDSSKKPIQLADGDHQLVLRLSGSIKDSKEILLYKTGYYVITMNTQGDSQLKLAAKPIKRMRDASGFDKNPGFFLTDNSGKAVSFKMAYLKKEGVQFGRDMVRELQEFNATGNSAAIESRAPFAALAMNNPQTELKNGSSNVSEVLLSEQMLHYWF